MASKNDPIFSEEYSSGSTETITSPSSPLTTSELIDKIEQDIKRYGLGKPKRIKIRAKVAEAEDSHDQS